MAGPGKRTRASALQGGGQDKDVPTSHKGVAKRRDDFKKKRGKKGKKKLFI
jgi:hypothetical protein